MFVLALGILHHSMRAYNHGAYAIGTAYDTRPGKFHDTIGMFVNTVLVPFLGGKEGGEETLSEVYNRWISDILPNATTPYDMVSNMGYGCNVYLAYNVGIFGSSSKSNIMKSAPQFQSVNVDAQEEVTAANFDLSVT